MRSEAPRADRALVVLLAVLAWPGPASAGGTDRVSIQGLADAELWNTESGSRLLARNDDEPATLGRLRLWAGVDIARGLEGFALGAVESGDAYENGETEIRLEQGFLRYYFPGPAHLMLDAGKIVAPFGNFSRRYLSNVNPLVGAPDGYSVSYPVGAALIGRVAKLDWKLALLDKPLTNENYVPASDRALRPALSVGFTPVIGFRIATYYTKGPYLGDGVKPMLPDGSRWRDFDQEIAGIEVALARGYFELNGDLAYSSYDVPTYAAAARGRAWFVEPKYTWTPRLFTALRVEYNDYPYILPISEYYWVGQNAAFYDVEVGAGWRFTPDLLLKAAYREDRWDVEDHDFFPDGRSVSVQLSYAFDVKSWFERPE